MLTNVKVRGTYGEVQLALLLEQFLSPGQFVKMPASSRMGPSALNTRSSSPLMGPTNLAALLTSFQMGFRSLALQKRSSEVWQLLGAIKTEFDRYGTVVNTLSKQLTTATNSVESLGRRTRAMSRKLKGVETLPCDKTAGSLLGFSADDFIEGGDEIGVVAEELALA